MAKRKPAPKATYTYVASGEDPVTPKTKVTTAKQRKTGGIKKVKTSGDKPISQKQKVTRLNSKEDIVASNAGEEAKRLGAEAFAKAQDADLRTSVPTADRAPVARPAMEDPARHSSRKAELEHALTEAPYSNTVPAPRKEGLGSIPADTAAGPALVPTRGTAPGSKPASVDKGDEFGGLVEVQSRGGRRGRSRGSVGAPDAITVQGGNPDIREERSSADIKETKKRAKNRTAGGRRTTVFDPNALSGRSGSRDARNRRFGKKMAKRVASGKVKLPGQVLASAGQAEAAAAEGVAAKAKIDVNTVGGRDATNFVHTDESMAQDLSRNHLTQHSASEIQAYVKSVGSDMLSFHTHVRHAANASKMIEVGPEGDRRQRSAGKITTWVKNPAAKIDPKTKKMAVNPVTKETEPEFIAQSGYEGWHTVNTRGGQDNKQNVRVWKKFEAPKGGLSHIEYLSHQIQKHKENAAIDAKDTRSLNRSRRRHRATAALVDAMTGGGVVTDNTPKGKARIPKGTSGDFVSTKPGAEPVIVKSEKPGFTEVKPPRSRRS